MDKHDCCTRVSHKRCLESHAKLKQFKRLENTSQIWAGVYFFTASHMFSNAICVIGDSALFFIYLYNAYIHDAVLFIIAYAISEIKLDLYMLI